MTDKLFDTLRQNYAFFMAVAMLLMLLGVWYYSTKSLPDRVVCLEKQVKINEGAILHHEKQFEKMDAKLDKISDKLERLLLMRTGSSGGAK
ncbi:MAG TPA: hypothetical protein PKW18_13815 [Candidatus Sumerlaeota bacterium]|nr:hypothetical protein [Candidatus Sumerlaeota bacterium]HOR65914.1 hypothetical protein [Candidatus Sumerlaeota bacterium]HPL75631.1 hypothetical protein [Candidatus Sumerlaeota bacterium]HRR31262.1 hypothetical protein [Candidatus Sumerlaeia bacterium]